MDDPGMHEANDQSGEGKDALSSPVESNEQPTPQPQQDEVVKPPGTSYPVMGK